jgi:glycogen debranching enzyme
METEKKQNNIYGNLWNLGVKSIKELETERGILASGREEVFGCIFGRDSLITSLSLLLVYKKTGDTYFLELVKKILSNLALLQGKEVNIESGEEPGKCIHEYRPKDHERLTAIGAGSWYVYPDKAMRNYDSVDATPLLLMAFYKYYKASGDESFLVQHLPNIRQAISWLTQYGDSNGDGFIDYRFHPDRIYGGLKTQSWMDSAESIFYESSNEIPSYPIAPVEVQAYTYVALREWGEYFLLHDQDLAEDLLKRAKILKERFNSTFVINRRGRFSLGFALDGNKKLLKSARSSMSHCLWAVAGDESKKESILDNEYVPGLVTRLLSRDLFLPRAGIRTVSSRSSHFDPRSYHNGSVWPHDTAILAEGLEKWGYSDEARRVRQSLLHAYSHFSTPIELFAYYRGRFREYQNPSGGGACRVQAWSAASILSTVSSL